MDKLLEDLERLTQPLPQREAFGARVFKVTKEDVRLTWVKVTGGELKVKAELLRPGGRTLPLERQGRPAAAVQRGQVPAGGHGPAWGRGGGGWSLRRLPRGGAGQRTGRQPARFGAGAAVPGAAAPGHRGAQGLGPAAGVGAGGPAPPRGVGRAPGAGALAADGRGAAGGAPKPGGAAVWLAGRL